MTTRPIGCCRHAFSLVEMLVVVALIAALVAVVSRAARHSDAVAEQVVCQTNLRDLSAAYLAYPIDHSGRIVYGYPDDAHPAAFVRRGAGHEPIRQGALYDYHQDVNAWRCASDPNPHGNVRNYAIVSPLHGERWDKRDCEADTWAQAGADRLDAITNPARQMVFVEEWDSRDWISGSWMMKVCDNVEYEWIDYVSNFHGAASNYAFADGHVERYDYADPDTIDAADDGRYFLTDDGNVDWQWHRARYRALRPSGHISMWR